MRPSLTALDMEIVGQIKQINPNGTVDINIVRYERKDRIPIAVFNVNISYKETRNEFVIKNVQLIEEKERYKKLFRMTGSSSALIAERYNKKN